MRVFKNKEFNKWAKRLGIGNTDLIYSVREMNNGLYEANLGGGVYKKRLACGGKGKRGGVRIIIAFLIKKKVFFIYGFSKNKMGNIAKRDEEALKELAALYLSFSDREIEIAMNADELIEVKYEKIDIKSSS